MSEPLSIVIADDHPVFRTGLRQIIERDSTLQVLGEAGNGIEALEAIRSLQPTITLLDLHMPILGGLDVAATVNRERLHVSLLVLTMYDDEDMFNEAMEYGVRGYILKDSAALDIVRGIHAVAEGRYFISPALSRIPAKTIPATHADVETRLHLDLLTPSELHVLRCIAEGRKSTEMADTLSISIRTVERHRENICRKLELSGAYVLVRFALEHRELLIRGC
ncbi:MAG: response regulator transcription factor [Bacteroidetes bacterium]|nr:response regulator transcription factor [Bacteroidota bacterium]